MATIGVQFAQSLVLALSLASVMLMAGLVLVRVVRTAAAKAQPGRAAGVTLALAPVRAMEQVSGIRRSAGVSALALTWAPPPYVNATWRGQIPNPKLQLSE